MDKNIDLQYAIDNGIIDLPNIQSIIEMTKKQELLDKHPFRVWYGTDNKWHTYLPDEEKGRIPRKRNSKEKIENVIIEYWKEKEENPTIKELFNEWNNSQVDKGFIKINTALRNESLFKRHFTEFGERRIKNVTIDMWVEFLESRHSDEKTPRNVNFIVFLESFFFIIFIRYQTGYQDQIYLFFKERERRDWILGYFILIFSLNLLIRSSGIT